MGNKFGGEWTRIKLEILRKYLDAYTSALREKPFKNKTFELVYIDAFAGTGGIEINSKGYNEVKEFIDGSVQIALGIDNKPFDYFHFIEKDESRCRSLKKIKEANPMKEKISIYQEDANLFLQRDLDVTMQGYRRGVLFLDPFATAVKWSTVVAIADNKKLDTWILFPASSIARLIPTVNRPEDLEEWKRKKLNGVFGDNSWEKVYSDVKQQSLVEIEPIRDRGVDALTEIYKNKLKETLGDRFLDKSVKLLTSTKVPLFEFMFFTGDPHEKAISASHSIARNILRGYKSS